MGRVLEQDGLPAAHTALADREPGDAHPLALARTLRLPLWSNGKDLAGARGGALYNGQLLRKLEA